jgi:hypothetical protein
MQDGAKEIACAISTSAMDHLERGPRARPSEREEQFTRLRERIEACTKRNYQATEFECTQGIALRSIDSREWARASCCRIRQPVLWNAQCRGFLSSALRCSDGASRRLRSVRRARCRCAIAVPD